jgi:cell wall-associated NlpC family hydrolase
MKLRVVLLLALACGTVADVRAAENEGFFGRVKHFFTGTPTPAPTPKKKKTPRRQSPAPSSRPRTSPHRTASPSPQPTMTSTPSVSSSPMESGTPLESPTPGETPSVTPKTEESATPAPAASRTEPAISPPPVVEETETLSVTPAPTARTAVKAAPSATERKGRTAPVSLSPSDIAGYAAYPPPVRKMLDLALNLTNQNLGYKYGSADPAKGGMDCSGFIYYVLGKSGVSNPPRDARQQYVWVRKAGKFQAVLGRSQDSFELDGLKPGDLLFWASTYGVDREPAITQTMLYLGREKATNQRVMVGASDGRTYKGQSRIGVSVFDFKIAGRRVSVSEEPGPVFVGYASIPGLGDS